MNTIYENENEKIQVAFCKNRSEIILKLKILLIRQLLIYIIVDKRSGRKFLTFATTCDPLLLNFLLFAYLNIIWTVVCFQ